MKDDPRGQAAMLGCWLIRICLDLPILLQVCKEDKDPSLYHDVHKPVTVIDYSFRAHVHYN